MNTVAGSLAVAWPLHNYLMLPVPVIDIEVKKGGKSYFVGLTN